MNTQYDSWQNVFTDFLVAGAIIFVLFRLLKYIVPLLLIRKKRNHPIRDALPIAEAVTWILFLSWYALRFAEIRSVYAFVVIAVLFILLFWFSRFFARDLIAGIIFRASGRFREGEVIIHENLKGRIRKFRMQSVEIETAEGQHVFIPYSRLSEVPAIKHESAEQSSAYNFQVRVSGTKPASELQEEIKRYLISLPWTSVRKNPAVSVKEDGNGQFLADITVYPYEKHFGGKIEHLTLEKFTGRLEGK